MCKWSLEVVADRVKDYVEVYHCQNMSGWSKEVGQVYVLKHETDKGQFDWYHVTAESMQSIYLMLLWCSGMDCHVVWYTYIPLHFKLFSMPWNSHSRLPSRCMADLLRIVMNNFAQVINTSIKFYHGSFLYHCLLSILHSFWICWPLLILAIFILVEISGRFGGPLTS